MIGTVLAHYRITAALGAGGMGEVSRATDTKLGRDVAIKVLPEEFFEDGDRVARFEQEARVLARLNHPGIAAIHAFEEVAGRHLLAMELVEGETLADRIARGPLPLRQTLMLGEQIASALEAAHRKTIVHRDLKPGNIMVTASGAKLLDFGLAKMLRKNDAAGSLTSAPTAERDVTREGVILGTLSYMAPEQLEGREADARTDIFAFGAVLYEMVTGRKAFAGPSRASVISAILSGDPPSVSTIQPMTPPALDRLVRTCLAKEPDERWQNAGDIARELKWIAEGSAAAGSPAVAADAGRPRRRERLAWGAAAVAALFGVAGLLGPRRAVPPEELTRFKILPPPGQNLLAFAVLSPDARRLLLQLRDDGGRNRLAVRSLDSLDVRILPGTDDTRGAFWSADGREIAFFADGKLKRISADGGPARAVCNAGGAVWGAWSPEGTILFATDFGGPLYAVPAAGGALTQATALDATVGEVHQNQPCFLPDGRHYVYFAANADQSKRMIRLGSLDSKETRPLLESDSNAVWADGYLIFARDDAVLAWRFDAKSLRLVGEPFPAFENVHWANADNFLSLSAAGNRVAYVSWTLRRQLEWVDRKGRAGGTLGGIAGYADLRISPDGRRVAVAIRGPAHGGNGDIWVLDAARGTSERVTSEPTDDFNPAWFPDGEHLAYVSDRWGAYNVFKRPAAGGPETVLVRSELDKMLPAVLADGRHLLVSLYKSGKYSRQILSLDDSKSFLRLGADSRFSEEHSVISADGRWTAFDSMESGQREVYLQLVPDGPKRQVSIGGGQMPVWNRNGRELFYAARDGTLMSVVLRPESGGLEAAKPQPLFPLQFDLSGELPWHLQPYDVAPDGQRFLVIRRAPGVEPDGVVVVTNWVATLRKAP
jgi:Tol biopolymer transport system component